MILGFSRMSVSISLYDLNLQTFVDTQKMRKFREKLLIIEQENIVLNNNAYISSDNMGIIRKDIEK